MDAFPYGLMIAVSGAAIFLVVVMLRALGERHDRTAVACRTSGSHRAHSRTSQAGRIGAGTGDDPGFLGTEVATCQGIEVHEHESALGLADELLSGGSTRGAPHVLADFAKSNPRQAVEPWLRLLDVYRDAGARDEYETIARGLHDHFNVRPPAWSPGDVADRGVGIESYPHVIERIVAHWGTRACHEYLGRLLTDNRGGSRTGFGVEALSDILLLVDVSDAVAAAAHRSRKAAQTSAPNRRAA